MSRSIQCIFLYLTSLAQKNISETVPVAMHISSSIPCVDEYYNIKELLHSCLSIFLLIDTWFVSRLGFL